MKKISQEKLNSYTSEELLDILNRTFMARALARKDSRLTSEDIGRVQRAIVKTIWIKYPEVAKKEGFKRIRTISRGE